MTALATPHILVVEDDREISALVARYLRGNDCRVTLAGDGREMDRALAEARIDLIVLDLMLPGEDGFSLCRRLRETSQIPILMLTAKSEEVDRILGLELGADDYLAKPFNPRELLARIRAILRRVSAEAPEPDERKRLHFAGWTLDVSLRQLLSPEGARVAITGAEFDLLHALCLRPGRVLSRDQLLDLTQGRAAGPFERSIDVLVSRIRQKIEVDTRNPEYIRTIRSGGYLFTPEGIARPPAPAQHRGADRPPRGGGHRRGACGGHGLVLPAARAAEPGRPARRRGGAGRRAGPSPRRGRALGPARPHRGGGALPAASRCGTLGRGGTAGSRARPRPGGDPPPARGGRSPGDDHQPQALQRQRLPAYRHRHRQRRALPCDPGRRSPAPAAPGRPDLHHRVPGPDAGAPLRVGDAGAHRAARPPRQRGGGVRRPRRSRRPAPGRAGGGAGGVERPGQDALPRAPPHR
ncbi:hypothetical protein Lal_00041059 [Lupinus albus]|nr:hypothetical protein Lal_00041059 [Lupinus albus]